jgi:hypothetical protein
MRIQICIATFERALSLGRLLSDLEREGVQRVWIYDDCSQRDDYARPMIQAKNNGWRWTRADNNFGRVGRPRFYERIWRDLASAQPADLYIFLEDDNRLCLGFADRVINTWQRIKSPSKGGLMLYTDTREQIWGAAEPPRSLGDVDLVGWIDSTCLLSAAVLSDLNFAFPVIPPTPEKTSSGVGIGITDALRKLGRTMYRANPSLVAHVSWPSRMHPGKEREINPLHAKNFVDGDARHEQLLRGEA